jgi:hypothetical protein
MVGFYFLYNFKKFKMKKIFFLLALTISFNGFTQSFSLYKTDVNFVPTATISNGNYVYESTAANALKITKFKIKNNAAVTQTFNVTRSIVSQSPLLDLSTVANAPTTYFCYGFNCFTPAVNTPGAADYTILLASGQTSSVFPNADNTVDNNQPFSIDLEEGPVTGNYVVKYKLFNVANPNDSLAFFIGYNQPLGLKDQDQNIDLSVNLFPNPTNHHATVLINSINNVNVIINVTNSLGQLVYSNNYKYLFYIKYTISDLKLMEKIKGKIISNLIIINSISC